MGYVLELGPVTYDGWRDGRPFTLADCWRECEGVAGARILAPTGRVVLDDAGSVTVRTVNVPRAARIARNRARVCRRAGA